LAFCYLIYSYPVWWEEVNLLGEGIEVKTWMLFKALSQTAQFVSGQSSIQKRDDKFRLVGILIAKKLKKRKKGDKNVKTLKRPREKTTQIKSDKTEKQHLNSWKNFRDSLKKRENHPRKNAVYRFKPRRLQFFKLQ
jgi:hypothetical protein